MPVWGEDGVIDVDEDLVGELGDLLSEDPLSSEVKKSIQIEFHIEDYDEAYSLINSARSNGVEVGRELLKLARTW